MQPHLKRKVPLDQKRCFIISFRPTKILSVTNIFTSSSNLTHGVYCTPGGIDFINLLAPSSEHDEEVEGDGGARTGPGAEAKGGSS